LVQQGCAWGATAPPNSLLAVPNVTAHQSTSSVPITILLYEGPLLWGFNVAIKGLKMCCCQAITCQDQNKTVQQRCNTENKKLSCRRETARCFMSLNISLYFVPSCTPLPEKVGGTCTPCTPLFRRPWLLRQYIVYTVCNFCQRLLSVGFHMTNYSSIALTIGLWWSASSM